MEKRKKRITLKQIEELAKLQCTLREAAALLGISHAKFRKILSADYRVSEAWERGTEAGKVGIRRKQSRLANTNAQMAIHLGKQYLGQNESTPQGPAQEINVNVDNLSEEEREKFRELLDRLEGQAPEKS